MVKVVILKSQLYSHFTQYIYCRAFFWEIFTSDNDNCVKIDILKSRLYSHLKQYI